MYLSLEQFHIPDGVISVIGSGGKTTFLRLLAESLPGRILLTTTTHIEPFPGIPLVESAAGETKEALLGRLEAALRETRVVCLGTPMEPGADCEKGGGSRGPGADCKKEGGSREPAPAGPARGRIGKLSGPPVDPGAFSPLFDHILVEADGSRRHPLKAHRPFEPVISPATSLTVCLAGLSGLGRRPEEVCHCPELFCSIAGSGLTDPVTAGHVARVLSTEDLADVYLLNQTDVLADPEAALDLCAAIKKPTLAGSLLKRTFL